MDEEARHYGYSAAEMFQEEQELLEELGCNNCSNFNSKDFDENKCIKCYQKAGR